MVLTCNIIIILYLKDINIDLLPVPAGHVLGEPVVASEALVAERTRPLAAGVQAGVGRGRGLH